jgi:hypothetical protein
VKFAALEADLHLLSALSGHDDDIEGLLRAMVADLKAAVPSAIGLSLTVHVSGQDVTLTTLEDENTRPIGASILVPLGATAAPSEGTCIVLYAAAPGAFVDLAADLGWATGLTAEMILLDQHLLLPVEGSAVTGLRELSTINQAIGMLIEQGNSPESARTELERRAECRGTTVDTAAAEIISAMRAGRSVA